MVTSWSAISTGEKFSSPKRNGCDPAQFSVVRETLSPAEIGCREFACLTSIADERGVDIVVVGRVVNNQQVKVSYHLRVRVVEKTGGKVDKREREVDCEDCTEPQARDRLARLMSAVIANEPEPKAVATPSPAPKHEGPQYRDRFSSGERWALRGTGIAALALGIGFIAQGFVELSHNGDIVTQNGQQYRRDTTKPGQPHFSSPVGAVAAVARNCADCYRLAPVDGASST